MKVYIDLLFFNLFIVHFFLLEMISFVLHEKTSHKRKIVAAIAMTVYSLGGMFLNVRFLESGVVIFLFSIIIVKIAFCPKRTDDFIKEIMVLFLITYLLGGMMASFANEISSGCVAMVVAMLICFFLVIGYQKIIKQRIIKNGFICQWKMMINDLVVTGKALIDTGHDLFDTVTGDTVIIINDNKIFQASEDLFHILKGFICEIPDEYQTKIRMVSYHSIGNPYDVLYGIKADSVVVYYDGKAIENKNVVVAMTENMFDKFDAIIGFNLIEGGSVIGDSFIVKTKSKTFVG